MEKRNLVCLRVQNQIDLTVNYGSVLNRELWFSLNVDILQPYYIDDMHLRKTFSRLHLLSSMFT